MRRFITSLPGKVIGQVVIAALILPSITLALFARASAQIATLPSWAVTEFVNKKSAGTAFGKNAADAVANELAKTQHYDVVPADTVKRATETLGIATPPDGLTNLLRLGEEVRATSVVSGEIVDYRVQSAGGGKQASVVVRVIVHDVASGLSVNGAAMRGVSSIRSGTVSDETLINDAFLQVAGKVVREIEAHRLPVGTVLNTQQNKALINKGARAGFANGQEVIVLRNHEQVATAKVTDVEPDSSYIVANNVVRGIQPGDRVRVVFKVPEVDVDPVGNPHVHQFKNTSFPSGLVSVGLVLGLVAALVGAGNGGSESTVQDVTASAYMFPNSSGTTSVQIEWGNTAFAGNNYQRATYQIWRSDVLTSPVGVASGLTTNYVDQMGTGTIVGALNYAVFAAQTIGNDTVCNYSLPYDTTNALAIPSITPGTQYIYQVQEVFDLLAIDLPNGGGSVTGSTSGTSTSTTSSTGSTATTGTTGTTGTT